MLDFGNATATVLDDELTELVVGEAFVAAVDSVTSYTSVVVGSARRRHLLEDDTVVQVDINAEADLSMSVDAEAALEQSLESAFRNGDLAAAMLAAARDAEAWSSLQSDAILGSVLVNESLATVASTLEVSVTTHRPTPAPHASSGSKKNSASFAVTAAFVFVLVLFLFLGLCALASCVHHKYFAKLTAHDLGDVPARLEIKDKAVTARLEKASPARAFRGLSPKRGLSPRRAFSPEKVVSSITLEDQAPDDASAVANSEEWQQMLDDVDHELPPDDFNKDVASVLLFRLAQRDQPHGFASINALADVLAERGDLVAMLGLDSADAAIGVIAAARTDDFGRVSRHQFLQALDAKLDAPEDVVLAPPHLRHRKQQNPFRTSPTDNPLLQGDYPPPPPYAATSPPEPEYVPWHHKNGGRHVLVSTTGTSEEKAVEALPPPVPV